MDEKRLVSELSKLTDEQLLWVLGQVELAERDQVERAIRAVNASKNAPLAQLDSASQAVASWAKDDPARVNFVGEINDISRRIAGDIATSRE